MDLKIISLWLSEVVLPAGKGLRLIRLSEAWRADVLLEGIGGVEDGLEIVG